MEQIQSVAVSSMRLAPIVDGEIDHRKAGGREFFEQLLADIDVAGRH
jgi:hypothetical protein